MELNMRLHNKQFVLVRDGKKHFEFRVNDEKRKELSIGDTIIFSNRDNMDFKIKVRVTALLYYSSFSELANDVHQRLLGEVGITTKKFLENMYKYYSKSKEREFGVVGIKFDKLD